MLFSVQLIWLSIGGIPMIELWKRIYPYVLAIADFWEDFLKFEDGQYQIYEDAENEKSGFCKTQVCP